MTQIDDFLLHEHGWVPNNPRLPVLHYVGLIEDDRETTARWFEQRFEANGWPPQWRDTIYDYDHYHSTAHEALGIACGSARLMLGGPGGRELDVRAGDALVLPAGTGHRRIDASKDYLVVGAYPEGQDWDICRAAPSQSMRQRMRNLPVPARDPIDGEVGSLVWLWPHPVNSEDG